jgi:hypothetical protein
MPLHIPRRRQQRLWRRSEGQVGAKVHEHEPVMAMVAKKSQHKCLRPKHCTVYPTGTLLTKYRIFASQSQQVSV